MDQYMPLVNDLPKDQKEEALRKLPEKIEKFREDIKTGREFYKENKKDCDAEAFAVLDVNGDGQLQLNEVVQALQVGTEQHKKLCDALRVRPPMGSIMSGN